MRSRCGASSRHRTPPKRASRSPTARAHTCAIAPPKRRLPKTVEQLASNARPRIAGTPVGLFKRMREGMRVAVLEYPQDGLSQVGGHAHIWPAEDAVGGVPGDEGVFTRRMGTPAEVKIVSGNSDVGHMHHEVLARDTR